LTPDTPCPSSSIVQRLWRSFTHEELLARDKVNLDIFWLRDESLEDSANLPSSEILASRFAEDLRSVLAQFESIEEELTDRKF